MSSLLEHEFVEYIGDDCSTQRRSSHLICSIFPIRTQQTDLQGPLASHEQAREFQLAYGGDGSFRRTRLSGFQ